MRPLSGHSCGMLACGRVGRMHLARGGEAGRVANDAGGDRGGVARRRRCVDPARPDGLVVAPAAGVLLAAADQHAWNYLEPCSDDAWRAVVDAAAQLAQTVATLSRSALVRGRADWLQWAAAMREGADTGTAAARRHGPRVLFAAGAQLRAGCQACHARYVAQIAEPLAEIASR